MILDWLKPETELPKVKDTIGTRKRDSEVVLVFVGENCYSERECTLAFYNYSNKCWEFLEEQFSPFAVLLWCYFPTTNDFENINQDL